MNTENKPVLVRPCAGCSHRILVNIGTSSVPVGDYNCNMGLVTPDIGNTCPSRDSSIAQSRFQPETFTPITKRVSDLLWLNGE